MLRAGQKHPSFRAQAAQISHFNVVKTGDDYCSGCRDVLAGCLASASCGGDVFGGAAGLDCYPAFHRGGSDCPERTRSLHQLYERCYSAQGQIGPG